MQWTGLNELREKYLSFFESKGHLRLDSFPLVPKNGISPAMIFENIVAMCLCFIGIFRCMILCCLTLCKIA